MTNSKKIINYKLQNKSIMKDPKTIFALLILSLTTTLGLSLPAYSQSSFLEKFLHPDYIGLYFAGLNVLAVISMFLYPSIIRKIGNFKSAILLFPVAVLGLFATGFAENSWQILLFFLCQYLALNLLYINIDLAAETTVDQEHVGRLRTAMLTAVNLSWLVSPLLMSLIATNISYQSVYLFSGSLILISVPFLKKRFLRGAKTFSHRHFRNTMSIILKRADLWGISFLAVILQVFYCLMTLYLPLLLREQLNFSWEKIGWLFTFMLLPFVLFQIPTGRLADKKWGEKEMLFIGLIIMSCACLIVGWQNTTSFVFWAALLFFSRVGASIFEAMTETYFFKKIHASDVDLINFFRAFRPFGWLVGSLFAFIGLKLLNINGLFLSLACFMLLGIIPIIIIKDTK